MEIFISIDGVLRNTIQKFDYHYNDAYLDSELEEGNTFEYNKIGEVQNDNLLNYYKFQSIEEFEYFAYIEYPIEIFGHAGLSYSTTFSDLNRMIHENPEHTFTLVGLDELGKSKPATLFFLSKNGFLGNNITFIKSQDIENMWSKCDVWITDCEKILEKCSNEKIGIKFNTTYNQYFTYKKEISKLTEIQESWSNYSEKTTTLISMESQKNVEQDTQ